MEQIPAQKIVSQKIKFKIESIISDKGGNFIMIERLNSPEKYNNFNLVT